MGGFIVGILLLVLPILHPVHADYVLPYPSSMPGNKLYTAMRIMDRLKGYWSWGDIGQFRYHLGLSDKYLVEAKTLFEYKQYLLAASALTRSDAEFSKTPGYLVSAKTHGKDVTHLTALLRDAAAAHRTVLAKLTEETPESFTWTPEKASATGLPIGDMLTASRNVREAVASEAGNL